MTRRVLFQIHLWTGIATGLYIIVICLSGSAIVFRRGNAGRPFLRDLHNVLGLPETDQNFRRTPA